MDQIITFNKSLSERLDEYNQVFSCSNIPNSTIEKVWSFYLEFTLDPNGWQAIWKIPRLKCESLQLHFPTIVLVYVVQVNFKELTGLVRVLAVQDDIIIPEKHHVPLSQLWPTKNQDKSIGLNMELTANVMDMFRFFYIHLQMPWDDENSSDWRTKHLESRLRFFYDLKDGTIPKTTSEHVYSLLNEAKRLHNKLQYLEGHIREEFSQDEEDFEGEKIDKEMLEKLTEMNVRMMEIQAELEILESPLTRQVIVRRREMKLGKGDGEKAKTVWVVFKNGKADDYINFLQKLKNDYPDESVTFTTDIMSLIHSANQSDTFVLSESEHVIKTDGARGALIENWSIRGLLDRQNTVLVSRVDDVMLDFIGDDGATVENVKIDAISSQCAVLVRRGRAVLRNCRIVGDETSSTPQGIVVLNGAQLELHNCEMSGFATAVVGNSGAKITMTNVEIRGAYVGVKIFDECEVSVVKSVIKDCREYGVVVETEKEYSGEKIGGCDTLKIVNGVRTDDFTGTGNGKADVIIKTPKIRAMDDLFVNCDTDPTIVEESDNDEMEIANNSIVDVDNYAYNDVM